MVRAIICLEFVVPSLFTPTMLVSQSSFPPGLIPPGFNYWGCYAGPSLSVGGLVVWTSPLVASQMSDVYYSQCLVHRQCIRNGGVRITVRSENLAVGL